MILQEGKQKAASNHRQPVLHSGHSQPGSYLKDDKLPLVFVAALASTSPLVLLLRSGLRRPRPRRILRSGRFSSLRQSRSTQIFGQAQDLGPGRAARWQGLTARHATDTGVEATATVSSEEEEQEEQEYQSNGNRQQDESERSSDEDWTDRMRRAFKNQDWKLLSRLMVTMGRPHRGKANSIIIAEVMDSQGHDGYLWNYCNMMKAFGNPVTYTRDGVHKVSLMDLWRQTKDWFRDQKPSLSAWSIVLTALCDQRNDCLEDADELLQHLEADPAAKKPTAQMYARFIEAAGRHRSSRDAMAILHRMMDHSVEPKSECFAALVRVLAKEDTLSVDAVKYWLRRAEASYRSQYASGHELDSPETRLPRMYADLITGYAHCGRLQDAFSVLGMLRMRGLKPSSYCFLQLMRACMKWSSQGLAECRTLLRMMVQAGVKPGVKHYNVVIAGYGSRGMLQNALILADRMRNNGLRWDQETYYHLINATIKGTKSNEVEMSVKLLGQMRREGVSPDAKHYILTIKGLGENGYISDATDIFGKLRSMGDLYPFAYDMMIRLYHLHYKKMDEAREVFDMMLEDEVEPRSITYLFLVRGYVDCGMHAEALEFYPQISDLLQRLEATLKSPKTSPQERKWVLGALSGQQLRHWSLTYNFLLEAAVHENNLALVNTLLKEVISRGIPFNDKKFARLIENVTMDLQGVAIPRVRFPRQRKSPTIERNMALWKRKEAQARWLRRLPKYFARQPLSVPGYARVSDGQVQSALGLSSWGNVRTRPTDEIAADWFHGGPNAQETPHLLSSAAAALPQDLLPAATQDAASSSAPRLHGWRLFQSCLKAPVPLRHAHAAVSEHYHATCHRRPLATLTLRRGEEVIVRTGQETQETLRHLFSRFGEPGEDGSPCYVFLSPWLCSLDALVTLLAASASFPDRVLLLRIAPRWQPEDHDEETDHDAGALLAKTLQRECESRGDATLGPSLVAILQALPVALVVNGKTMVTNSTALSDARVTTFEGDLQAMLSRPQPLARDWQTAPTAEDWKAWLRRNRLWQLVRCDNKTIRLDSLKHTPGWSTAELFRIQSVGKRVVIHLWDSELVDANAASTGGLTEYST
mmetsp:Transcript_44716/g.103391  ORF Transcript_44716/g.103391 Transcript_44716/m.103391 type:complete len:1099 (+) Transcript_44716:72-3368(+)